MEAHLLKNYAVVSIFVPTINWYWLLQQSESNQHRQTKRLSRTLLQQKESRLLQSKM